MNVTSFNMDVTNAKLVVASTEMGVAAYLYEADMEDDECCREAKSSEAIAFADLICTAMDRIEDGIEEAGKSDEAVIAVDFSDDEMLCVLAGIRCTFEMFISASPKDILSILGTMSGSVRPIMVNTKDLNRRRLARKTHALLDFLECHCPASVLETWIDNRKPAAKRILEEVTRDSKKRKRK